MDESTIDTMTPRSVPAIALKQSNNEGGHYFMSLYSDKRMNGYKWDMFPIYYLTIERVEQLAEDKNIPS